MSDLIKHECGLAFIRLLKPLDFYQKKYGTAFYGLQKLQLLLMKQRNRGQDGVGIATIKLNVEPGNRYISLKKSNASQQALQEVFKQVYKHFKDLKPGQLEDAEWMKDNKPYIGEVLLGHLRYATHGSDSIEHVHPFHRRNNWMNRNLLLAGNFNLTNVDELFNELVKLGQHPKEKSDTVTVLEKIGHFLDDEVQRLHTWFKPDGHDNAALNKLIYDNLDIQRLLKRASKKFDGGYVLAGLIGHGDAFVMRDPNGIRPAFYYKDDEVLVVASERPAIQSVFNVPIKKIEEVKPGHALICKYDGQISEKPFTEPKEKKSCTFERIYFSRGNDLDIYRERKKMGFLLTKPALESVNYDFDKTVFSFIPNTAESAFFGLMDGVERAMDKHKIEQILKQSEKKKPSSAQIEKILNHRPRIEKLVHKDEKQRTFIASNALRNQMVTHGYDVTYGLVNNDVDNIVIVDDSIVRGTTLRDSIIAICARLQPKKIVVLSAAPQIRYPDCYGIDMSKMKEFVAFQALLSLLEESGQDHLLQETYKKCLEQDKMPTDQIQNQVKALYDIFPYEAISRRIVEMVRPKNLKPELDVIFQTLEGLHEACPNHMGDWYFSGNYPTPGGNRVVNRAFINFMENNDGRAY